MVRSLSVTALVSASCLPTSGGLLLNEGGFRVSVSVCPFDGLSGSSTLICFVVHRL